MRYLPVLWYLLAAASLLFVAGLGAAGNVRGALRYMAIWAKHVGALALIGLLLALIVRGIMPSP